MSTTRNASVRIAGNSREDVESPKGAKVDPSSVHQDVFSLQSPSQLEPIVDVGREMVEASSSTAVISNTAISDTGISVTGISETGISGTVNESSSVMNDSATAELDSLLVSLSPGAVVSAVRTGQLRLAANGDFDVPGIDDVRANSSINNGKDYDAARLHDLVQGMVDCLPSLVGFVLNLHYGLDGESPCSTGRIAELLNSTQIPASVRSKLNELLDIHSIPKGVGPKGAGRTTEARTAKTPITLEHVEELIAHGQRQLCKRRIAQ